MCSILRLFTVGSLLNSYSVFDVILVNGCGAYSPNFTSMYRRTALSLQVEVRVNQALGLLRTSRCLHFF